VRQLTVVAVSDDGTHVLLAATSDAAKPTHSIAIDDRLAAAVRGELDTGPRRESALSPKEIQARLRAGDTPEQVAKAANVPVSRVLRFFGPVESERDRILTQARATTMRRTRAPAATLPLAEAAEQRFATTVGLRRDSIEWSAKRREDGAWVVALTYSAKGGQRSAAWLWQPAQHDLTALDANATRIALEQGPPPRRSTASVSATASPRRRPAVRKPKSKRSTKPAAATPDPTSVEPVEPVEPAAPAEAAAEAEAADAPAIRVRREPRVIPPPAARSGRIPVPSWDDVLFGAAPPVDTATDTDAATGTDAAGTSDGATKPRRATAPAATRGRRRS
jgi:hypothetical protein